MKSAPQQHRSRETVERLLDAANHEFAEHGVGGATTTKIAERAGVSVGSLYRFFGDKAALATALSDRYLDEAGERYGPIVAALASPSDLLPAVRDIVRGAGELQLTHPGYYRITEDDTPDSAASPASGVRQTLVELFASVLDRLEVGSTPELRRSAIALLTETVRHTLAIIGPVADDRTERLAELEELAVGYFAHRFDLAAERVDR